MHHKYFQNRCNKSRNSPYQMLSQPCFPLLLNNSSFFEAHNLRKSYSGEACLRYFCIAVIQLLRVLSFDKPCLNWSSSKKISIQINIPTQYFSLFFLKSIWIILWVRFCYRIIIYGKEHSGMRIILRHLLSERNKISPLRRCEFLRGY